MSFAAVFRINKIRRVNVVKYLYRGFYVIISNEEWF